MGVPVHPNDLTRCADCGIPEGQHLADGACPCSILWCIRRRNHAGRHLPHPGQTALPLDGEPTLDGVA